MQCDQQVHKPITDGNVVPSDASVASEFHNANVKLDIVDGICVFVEIMMHLNRSLIQ